MDYSPWGHKESDRTVRLTHAYHDPPCYTQIQPQNLSYLNPHSRHCEPDGVGNLFSSLELDNLAFLPLKL